MIFNMIFLSLAVFFFLKMRRYKKKAIEISNKFNAITKEKSKLSNSVRIKGLTIDRLERMNKDLQNELEH